MIENEIIIKKSKFITKLYNVNNVEEVNNIINKIKKEYKKATHVCYAYIINGQEKAIDDGEPSKTAGRPILNVLQKKNLNEIMIVVIRYFGGIKLGAGGLIRAYTKSTSEIIKIYEKKEN